MRYDAVQFLESLFRSGSVPAVPDPTPADLPPEWRDLYEERAAIREYDGGAPRELAEHFALLDVLEQMRKAGR